MKTVYPVVYCMLAFGSAAILFMPFGFSDIWLHQSCHGVVDQTAYRLRYRQSSFLDIGIKLTLRYARNHTAS